MAGFRHMLTVALFAWLSLPHAASAYIGPSYLKLPDVDGGWAGQPYKNWIRANSNYWRGGGRGAAGQGGLPSLDVWSGPKAPRTGANAALVIAIDKSIPAVRKLMEKCQAKAAIAELTYAESSALSGRSQAGDRPPQIPEFFEYRLSDVHITDCPVVAGATEQAFVISFNAIQWLNYSLPDAGVPALFTPVLLQPQEESDRVRSYVLTWMAVANDVSDDQCPVMADKPSPEEYYRYMTKEEADQERARLVKTGGPGNAQLGQRGPDKLDITRIPGIVPDPGQPQPTSAIARGVNLDGAAPAASVRSHKKYASGDGRTGIDNQFYTAVGCVPGVLGHKGFATQFTNSQMRDGAFSVLIQLSGVDNMRNDDSIDVSWFYSLDPMAKDSSGKAVLSDYTFRVTDKPQFTHYVGRMHGRIVDGVVLTDPLDTFAVNMGFYGFAAEKKLMHAVLRLQLLPDGGLKGVLGGYQDLWDEASRFNSAAGENQWNYVAPGVYNALKRSADGLKDPVTGEYLGISNAFDIEAVPAFIQRTPLKALAAGK